MQARVGVAAAAIGVAVVGLAVPASAASTESDQAAAVVLGADSAAGIPTAELPFRSGATESRAGTMAAGWLGTCRPYPNPNNSRSGGGWCDGNGPDARYRGWVDCSNGYSYSGPERWAGDQRRSYGTCPSGTSRISYWVHGYYV
ncbi:hypothetical protein [Micromonospora sp. NBRC 107095]|uniref:hypothetical protein n=1 Tax=Micromonospora sp. NBRC 107095 TaxID=3032209 RepID=UPI0024A3803D|nr:hypothetical protein [Micromonospora sp. NBRC 107095]GLZ57460.1 hypothetical protein Misp05_10360 [Micromonospora sp. NBRC 107095]